MDNKAEGSPDRPPKKLRRLQTELFGYILFIPLLVLTIFTVFFYYYNSDILISREQNSLKSLNNSIMSQTENMLSDLDEVSSNINYHNRKTDFLPDELLFHITSDQGQRFIDSIQTINGLDQKAQQINLYDFSGHVIEIGIITKNGSYVASDTSWLEEVKRQKGNKVLSLPYKTRKYSINGTKSGWYVSLYRASLDKYERMIGAVETVKPCKLLFREISSYLRTEPVPADIYIFGPDGSPVYPYDISEEEKASCAAYYSYIRSLDESFGKGTDPTTGTKIRYFSQTSGYSGWTYLTIQKDTVILQPVYNMLKILLGILLIMILVSILLSWFLSRSMVKPVKHLKHVIQRLGLENLGEEKLDNYNASYEELNELYVEFQKMSESLQESLQELEISQKLELKSRVIALQVQMNPHFYYNTLTCISILAENGQDKEVTKLCQTLSRIMRYITNTGTTIVSVREEIEYIREYMYCMQVRYQESLSFSIDILPKILDEQIPKLIIQPLVENSIKYGTDCLPPWHISISSFRDDTCWYIRVSDTGNGFREEVLTDLRKKIADINEDETNRLTDLKIGGLGMINVYMRWKLYCGDAIIFDFGNDENGHAYVNIGRKIST